MSTLIEVGDVVKSTLTGAEGIVFCVSNYLFGNTRIQVQQEMKPDKTVPDALWLDADECVIVSESKFSKAKV